MIKCLLFALATFLILATVAKSQVLPGIKSNSPTGILRELSGIVQDSLEVPIEGISILVTSRADTLKTTTNSKGIFILKDLQEARFLLTVSGLGYKPFVKRYLFNQETSKLVLDPIMLGSDGIQLNEVTVNGRPKIVYKTDTAEYRASDYKVRENSTVDALLKKMEGVQIARDGALSFQGQPVVQAKLNGKLFGEGNVAETIQSLPADIVEKAQFVDDYGDQAARTGIRTGNPIKILNLTTKAEKSIANLAKTSIGAGNEERNYERLYVQRINANQQVGLTGNFQKLVNGVASNSAAAAGTYAAETGTEDSGGYTTKGLWSLEYRDQWRQNMQVNSFYSLRSNNSNGVNYTNGSSFSSNGTTNFSNDEAKVAHTQNQQFRFEFELSPDSLNFLRITPSFSSSRINSTSNLSRINTGYLNQDLRGSGSQLLRTPTYEVLALYQRLFKGSRRNLSLQVNVSENHQDDLNERNYHVLYKDSTGTLIGDSLQHLRVDRTNMNRNYRSSFTYVEPFSNDSQLELNAQINYRAYENRAFTDSITALDARSPIPSLTNIYHYAFTEARISTNYRFTKGKSNYSFGLTAMPTILKGGTNITRKNLNLIPIFRYEHAFAQTERLSIYYNGSAVEPTFVQIQPFSDRSDPQNVIVGNPGLKPSFYHALNLAYNHYLANARLNVSVNTNLQLVRNGVTENVVQVRLPDVNSFYNEFHFQNIDGGYNCAGNHALSKLLFDGKLNVNLNGSVSLGRNKSVSNNSVYESKSWSVTEQFGLMLNLVEWLEINPDITYKVLEGLFSQPGSVNQHIRNTALNLESRVYLGSWKIGAEFSKIYTERIPVNFTKNPLVINGYLEKALLKGKNGLLRIQLFDLLKQNNWINQSISNFGILNTRSNVQSRYGYVSFVYSLQQWKGTPKKDGQPRKRRGDGSFLF